LKEDIPEDIGEFFWVLDSIMEKQPVPVCN
jgi:hypothetical protein